MLNPKVFEGVLQDGKEEGEVKVYDDWDGIDELLAFSGENISIPSCYLPPTSPVNSS